MYNIVGSLIRARASIPRIKSRISRRAGKRILDLKQTHSMNIENAIEIYLDWKRTHATMAPSRYSHRLFSFAKFVGTKKPLIEITGDDVIKYLRAMETTNFTRGKINRAYSKATLAYSSRIFKNFFMFWHGRRESNINHKEILPIRFIVPIKRVVLQDEMEKMNATFREGFFEDLRKKLAINLLWDTGMRVSELCDMNIADIHDKHPVHGVRSATIRTRKTMRYNLIAWSKETDNLLTQYLGIRLSIDTATDALFVNTNRDTSKGITVRTIERWIDEICEKAQLGKGISPHSFRHGKGHIILDASDGNIRDVAAVLRHVRPESAFHYVSLNKNRYLGTLARYLGGDKEKVKTA